MAYRLRYVMQFNAREAIHLLELRSSAQGHPAYRRIALEMHRLIAERGRTSRRCRGDDPSDQRGARARAAGSGAAAPSNAARRDGTVVTVVTIRPQGRWAPTPRLRPRTRRSGGSPTRSGRKSADGSRRRRRDDARRAGGGASRKRRTPTSRQSPTPRSSKTTRTRFVLEVTTTRRRRRRRGRRRGRGRGRGRRRGADHAHQAAGAPAKRRRTRTTSCCRPTTSRPTSIGS